MNVESKSEKPCQPWLGHLGTPHILDLGRSFSGLSGGSHRAVAVPVGQHFKNAGKMTAAESCRNFKTPALRLGLQ